MSLSCTTTAFGLPNPAKPNRYWVYYTITKSEDVEQKALQSNYLVVLMFWAPWNLLSNGMRTPFRAIALDNKHRAVFCSVNVDVCKNLAEKYAVEALPTFVLIKNSEVKGKVVGAEPAELRMAIQSNA